MPVFKNYVYIILGDAYEISDYLSNVKGLNVTIDPNTTDGYCIYQDSMGAFIWFQSDVSIEVLVHELSHAVFDIMENLGIDVKDQEVFCYMLEYLISECKNIFAIQMGPIKQVKENLDKVDEQA